MRAARNLGRFNPEAPAADLASRIQRLTYPEPFTVASTDRRAATHQDNLYPNNRPNPDRGPITW
jgi:hypothetical protein